MHRPERLASVRAVSRPVDVVLEFLEAEKNRGVTHVHLDDGARDALRELFIRAKRGHAPAQSVTLETVAPDQPAPAPTAPVTLTAPADGSRQDRLDALRRQAGRWQPALNLGTLRDTLVFSTGNPDARLMLVGEAPGYLEERAGEPFAGPAGQKLNDILKAMGISREEVYLTYIVKFRPAAARQTTNNRPATAEEMAACLPFVKEEIRIVRPECVLALGGGAAEGLLGLTGPLNAMRGPWHDFEGTPARVTWHPSHLLQSGSATPVKRQLWEDMLAVMEKLRLPISAKQRGFFLSK